MTTSTAYLLAAFIVHQVYFGRSANSQSCPPLHNLAGKTAAEVLTLTTDPCRYDKWARPSKNGEPTQVYARIYVYFLGSIEAQHLHFTAHILMRYRWVDPRLAHNAKENYLGEINLRDRVWTPHLYLVNEHDSRIMGSGRQDILISVQPDGTVLYSTRLKVTLLCLMNLKKFPFDEQECPLVLESWTYNTTGNYSSLTVYFGLEREVGHYIMDYYMPSIMLVVVSWVSFWLDPNAIPGRTTLGTATMLTFITLSRNTGSSLPKVSYIKATEIWFIVCTGFIFGSLVEFAFVNTIWRRRKNVELKKVTSKHILKSTLTPTLKRKEMNLAERCGLSAADRCSSLPAMARHKSNNNSETQLKQLEAMNSVDTISCDPFPSSNVNLTIPNSGLESEDKPASVFTMTPQEIATWIDKRSRIYFPLAFLIFNVFYWIFVYI
ncbi:hypothetical protein M8J75_004220 [Diaphorina citri]|nr:hypothetical protein M8J75_004220 [Diaphorina citri]